MHRSIAAVSLAALATLATVPLSALRAQGAEAAKIVVRTFTLQSISPEDAAKLVSPYVDFFPGGGVFQAGGALKAITVRATPDVLARVDSLLRANDRPRATVVFRFQLIAASDSAVRDPAIAAVDAELRNLFRFAGYRLVSQGTATANEREHFSLTMTGTAGDLGRFAGEPRTTPGPSFDLFTIDGDLVSVQTAGGRGSVHLRVSLERTDKMTTPAGVATVGKQTLLSTGLTVPLGQTVVLGSAAFGPPMPAIILVVRPEVAPKP